MKKEFERPLLLRGKVVHPDGSARFRYVFVRNGRVETVSRARPPLTKDAIYVKTESEDWIFPGLLDLHTHASYNLLPLWYSLLAPFNNRFEWRGDKGYRDEVRGTFKKVSTKENQKVMEVYAELQAVAGGTTVLQESKDLDRQVAPKHNLLLCRDTANPRDLYIDGKQKILSVVDLFRPNKETGKPVPVDWSFKAYRDNRKKKTLLATLAHLAEGRSGFGSNRGVDPYSRREFEAFMAHPAFKDAALVRESPLTIIHCSGIDVTDPKHIKFLRDRNISVIWSPVSNLLLYGDTLDAETLLAEGINVALGSDWSPSGSKHVWDEAKFARFYLDAIGSVVSNEQIFQMVTTNAGKCLGIPHLGRIEPGALGDFFILRSPLETDNPLEVFFSTSDRHVRATIIGGRPCYGARDFLKHFEVDLQNLPRVEGSAVENKAVHLPSELEVDVDSDITKIEKTMKGLTPPVKRSNLLASSDKIYRRRVQRLRAATTDLGWSVQEWRKRGGGERPDYVPVSPASVRVWRGFRAYDMDRGEFRKRVGEIFIPAAVQTQAPLGLTAYLPAVLPDDKPGSVPDEIALVFYESQQVYKKTFDTVIGRAYGLLHRPVFSPESKSGFPKLLDKDLESGTPYYLFNKKADWYCGLSKVLVGTSKRTHSPEKFLKTLYKKLRALQKNPPKGLDGVIVAASDDYLVYWEHWTEAEVADDATVSGLAGLVDEVLLSGARPQKVAMDIYEDYAGLDIKGGEFLNLRFGRRSLFLR